MDRFLGLLTVCCHLNMEFQEGRSVSVYKGKAEKKRMLEKVVVGTQGNRIYMHLMKCLMAGCLWTNV